MKIPKGRIKRALAEGVRDVMPMTPRRAKTAKLTRITIGEPVPKRSKEYTPTDKALWDMSERERKAVEKRQRKLAKRAKEGQ